MRAAFAAVALAMLPIAPACATPDPAAAAAFIDKTGAELATLAKAPGSGPQKAASLQPFLERVADVDGVARFCLGRFWATATPAQRQDYLAQFHRVLLAAVAGNLDTYKSGDAHVVVGRPSPREGDIAVPTRIERRGQPPYNVTWLVGDETGTLRITDVVAEGVSLRLTQRSDYASFLSRHGNDVGALIQALHEQASRQAEAPH